MKGKKDRMILYANTVNMFSKACIEDLNSNYHSYGYLGDFIK